MSDDDIEEWDRLRPGPELDALFVQACKGHWPDDHVKALPYSTDISAAWKIVEMMDFKFCLELAGPQDGDYSMDSQGEPYSLWRAQFSRKSWSGMNNPYEFDAAGLSAPHAITLAALRIIRKWKEP